MGKTTKDPVKSATNRALASIPQLYAAHKSTLPILLIGFIGGFLWLTGMRFYLAKTPETHYHANFAVYINGQREVFKEFTYYEEVAACTSAYTDNPKGRVHMHDNVNDVIHVHDKRVTYGNFFQNIGWNVGDEYIATKSDIYRADTQNKVVYIINGEEVENITNRIIGNTDRLLVSYGASTTDTTSQYETVATSASEVNKYQDPASCSGIGGAGNDSVTNRLKHATFWN